MNKEIEELYLNGYTVIENVLSDSLVTTLLKSFEKISKNYESNFDKKIINENEFGTIRCILSLDDVFLSLLEVDKIDKFANESMGNYNHYSFTGLYTSKDFVHPTTYFHRDLPIFVSGNILSLNVLYILDDTTLKNGATWVLPRSHTFPKRPSENYINKKKIQLTAKSGSVIILNSLTYHAAGINYSGLPRRSITNLFRKPFMKQQFQWQSALKSSTISKLSERQKHLLGFYNGPAMSIDQYHAEGVRRRELRKIKDVKTKYGIEIENNNY